MLYFTLLNLKVTHNLYSFVFSVVVSEVGMNIMRKFVHSNRGAMDAAQHVQDNNLGLMHLRKLFTEFRSPPPGVSQKELRDKLYNMLPLFCKVCILAHDSYRCLLLTSCNFPIFPAL